MKQRWMEWLAGGTMALAGMAALAAGAAADDEVTPQEVLAKVREAAAYLEKSGAAGLATFDRAQSDFVWKDTYVFVFDCAADVIVAHPVTSKGLTISTLKDVNGRPFGTELCKAAEQAGGGWTEYAWPKPVKAADGRQLGYAAAPSRKVSYILAVPGQPYQVGAGDYDDTLTLDQLGALLKQ